MEVFSFVQLVRGHHPRVTVLFIFQYTRDNGFGLSRVHVYFHPSYQNAFAGHAIPVRKLVIYRGGMRCRAAQAPREIKHDCAAAVEYASLVGVPKLLHSRGACRRPALMIAHRASSRQRARARERCRRYTKRSTRRRPIGPFHTTVPAHLMQFSNLATDFGARCRGPWPLSGMLRVRYDLRGGRRRKTPRVTTPSTRAG
jgi:hypothetical protein